MIRLSPLLILAACGGATVPQDLPVETADTAVEDTSPPPRPSLELAREIPNEATEPGRFETTLVAEGTYDGDTPVRYQYSGDVIRAQVGNQLAAVLDNQLQSPTTIHWHGAGAPYEMDGVPWQRQPTAPGEQFTYTFPLEQSGTFWFHPHFDTARQVDLGLYGVLIVEGPDEPEVVNDLVLILDAPHESAVDPHHHGLEGQALVWMVNGSIDPIGTLDAGPTRLRILNASNTGYLDLDTTDMTVLALDQGIRTAPWSTDSVVLGPGDRAELLVDLQGSMDLTSRPFSLHGGSAWGDPQRLLTLTGSGPSETPMPTFDVDPASPTPDPGTTDITYTFQGDGGSGQWRINHETFPDVTIEEVALGDDVIVEIRNLSPTNHPFHGHGHAFEVLGVNGVPPARYTLEDTVDVPIHGVVRVRFEATKAGDWMQHCHILPHAEGGMMTVLRVVDPEVP